MIIATNRRHSTKLINRKWDYEPEAKGEVNWININADGDVVDIQKSVDATLPKSINSAITNDLKGKKPEILVFAPGARRFDQDDFLTFQRKIANRGFNGVVIGYSPPFRGGFAGVRDLPSEWHRSHCSRESFNNVVDALLGIEGTPVSMMLQSAANDVCARAFELRKSSLPKLKYVVSAASPVDNSAYSLSAATNPAVDRKPVTNSHFTIDACQHFTAYYREDDWVLNNWIVPGTPLGIEPPREPYEYPTNVSFVDCERVFTGPFVIKHKCYESTKVVLRDIVEVLRGRVGDKRL